MKFSHDWLGQYVTLKETPERIGERMTLAGIPLDGFEAAAGATAEPDTIYDFDIFTNRPDCMNHLGLAREYGALAGSPLRLPSGKIAAGGKPTGGAATVVIEATDLCPRYSARCILGVTISPSPPWLRQRLESIGQRSINNVVDATNFVLWEMGHPLHPFDLERLAERSIVVRRAHSGESLRTLDGSDHRLNGDMLVIADARRPVALAGIMGGAASEIRDVTRDVLLESAWFDPVTTRRTARALGLRTDASHRFERGADPGVTMAALDRAACLIAELAGGSVTDPPLDVHPRPESQRSIRFRPSRASKLLGYSIPPPAMKQVLDRLAFEVTEQEPDLWMVLVPTFRRDVEREADLIEEVARHRGYDAIPSSMPLLPDAGGGRSGPERRIRDARRALLAAGLFEAVNVTMADRDDGLSFAPDLAAPVAIENPLQSQAGFLRTSLLPGLLRNVAHNMNHGLPGCRLFEIGTIFRPGGQTPEERTRAGFVFGGRGLPIHWSLPRREADIHDARGAAEILGDLLGISPLAFRSDKIPSMEPGTGMRVVVDGREIGVIGSIAGSILSRHEIERPVHAGEIDLTEVLAIPARERRYRALPRFPAVRRDLSLVIDRGVTYEAVEQVIRRAATVSIAEIQVFDRYRGRGVPRGQVSVAIQIVFQRSDRTLSTNEVQAAQDAIVAELGHALGASLRGGDAD